MPLEMKKVSILIPCYNSEKFLEETLQCCIKQQYSNIEVIIVDDGSTDLSAKIAEEWANKYDFIHFYRQTNLGACRARNLAFKKSTGDYILYLDADDIINSEYVESLITALDKGNKGDIVTGEWDRFCHNIKEATFPPLRIYKDYLNAFDLLMDMWTFGEMLCCSSYLISRELVEETGGWNEDILKNQDGEFFCRVLLAAKSVKHVSTAKFFYRTGDYLSVSKANSKKKVSSMLETFILYRKYSLAHEDSKRVKEALSANFTLFIYIYGNQYPDLCNRAQQEIKTLGVGYKLNTEPARIKMLCKIIGFTSFMKLRKYLYSR